MKAPTTQDTAADPFGMDQKIKNLQDMALSISRQGRQQAKKDDKERNPSLNLENPSFLQNSAINSSEVINKK
jgi:ATP adenylyltransferase/5',5'''-P-1,P-4-tetraphosphate phosphorylase II